MWGIAVIGSLASIVVVVDRLFPWLRSDLAALYHQLSVLFKTQFLIRQGRFITNLLEEQAVAQPMKPYIIFQDNEYTFQYMNQQANRIAHITVDKLGLKRGDNVVLLCYNEPAFLWTFYGLAKVGIHVAFLNTNLRKGPLLHCLKVCDPCRIFVGQGDDLLKALEDVMEDIDPELIIYTQGHSHVSPRYTQLEDLIADASVENIDPKYRGAIGASDVSCYIFTSGTTGLPKPAVISHRKHMLAASLMQFFNVRPDDIIYCTMPLYHSAASMLSCGNGITSGCTIVLRHKFSASNFWSDCCRHKVTIIHYIGELCRFLVNIPQDPNETKHCVRLAFGNGLRRDVWKVFQERFKIPRIGEFYAATEGNCGFVNIGNKQGAVGRLSPLMALLYPVYFIKYDFNTAEPVRNDKGHCMLVGKSEQGLMVAAIKEKMEYDGYKNNEELSNKKIIRNVFRMGDVYFNTGDLFTRDADYNIYFCDRIGDTFRWKGENISTIEVSNVVATFPQFEDANVYGVSVPGSDGRAGMAAVILTQECKELSESDCKSLYEMCSETLPAYAVPRFLRICPEMKLSSTHKQLKVEMVTEGFNPSAGHGDPLFYLDFKSKTYNPLDAVTYENINSGKVRL